MITKEKVKSILVLIFNMIFRSGALVPMMIVFAIYLIRIYIVSIYSFLFFGGEVIAHKNKQEKKTINDIFLLLQKDYKTSKENIDELSDHVKTKESQLQETINTLLKHQHFIRKYKLQEEWSDFKQAKEDDLCTGK